VADRPLDLALEAMRDAPSDESDRIFGRSE